MEPATTSAATPALHVLQETVRALRHMRSEASSDVLAAQIVRRYSALAPELRPAFFEFLGRELVADADRIAAAVRAWQDTPSDRTATDLARVAASPRRLLFEAIGAVPDGVDTLLGMRADLLDAARGQPGLAGVEHDLFDVLASWFNRGFLHLRQISWESPAEVLEKLIAYEAVHEIRGWDDLRRRLENDRRCFGLFHPVMPNEPLIFLEIALTNGMASSIHDVIDQPSLGREPAPVPATAVFYSITSCQPGLTGITLGSFLIKRVMAHLALELPTLNRFVTLSPIPGFCAWLAGERRHARGDEAEVLALLDRAGWHRDPEMTARLEPVLTRLCACYLAAAKRGAEPRDPVARFHLRNGARIERINWLGDTSPKGLAESAGLLVNYAYDETEITRNHEEYVLTGAVARSAEIDRLLAEAQASEMPMADASGA